MNGWLCLNKPAGMSSNFAMQKVRRILHERTGYIGTLDPFATGVLPIAVGEARKFIRFVEDGDKKYNFTIKFGATTDTLDRDGTIIESGGAIPGAENLLKAIESMRGRISQIPPKFSAIKIHGRKAYQLARQGKDVEIAPREVTINEINLENYDAANGLARVTAVCSKGTYIRSLARDIATKLGTFAFVDELHRLRSGFFQKNMCVNLEELSETSELISVAAPLNFPDFILQPNRIDRLQNGVTIDAEFAMPEEFVESSTMRKSIDPTYLKIIDPAGKFHGIAQVEQGRISPARMMSR